MINKKNINKKFILMINMYINNHIDKHSFDPLLYIKYNKYHYNHDEIHTMYN